MATIEVEDRNKKVSNGLRLRPGCKVFLLLVLLVPVICYGAMWLFARFGGELATHSDLPLPPNSHFLVNTFENEFGYTLKHSVYSSQSKPEELREWFIRSGIPMSPIPLNVEGTSVIEYNDYYGTPSPFHLSSTLHRLHELAAMFTHGWIEETVPDCQRILVYKDASLAFNDFPNIDLSSAASVFVITTCWRMLT